MYNFFYSDLKPTGWLKKQLIIQAKGLSGNLDKVWPDVGESVWIGGKRDDFERLPYWLDGFIPLGFLLEDRELIERSKKYIYYIIEHQQKDGWICPCTVEKRKTYDLWAYFLICKVMAQYILYTNDEKVKKCLYSAMKCLYDLLKAGDISLFYWAKYRWFEAFIPLQFLYEHYSEKWMIELGKILQMQGVDYPSLKEEWRRPLNSWTPKTHVVNIAMMLKFEAVTAALFNEKTSTQAEELYKFLKRYNGTAVETFTGDECLSGISNVQGTELCSVVELMYSCEIIYSITGKTVWVDRLEKLAFNALPATISDDMWTHQYDQQVNQISCVKFPGKSFFRTNDGDAHLFGLEPNFGCCTANFSQGWPKLAGFSFLKRKNEIHCAILLPSELHTTINGAKITLTVETEYPFKQNGKITVKVDRAVRFALSIRIPTWADSFTVNGAKSKGGKAIIEQLWNGTEQIEISFHTLPRLVNRPYGLKVLEYGPLVFSLPLNTKFTMFEYEKDGVERKYPYCDYELTTEDEWRYAFTSNNFEVLFDNVDDIPFSSKKPPISVKTNLCQIVWDFADGYNSVAEKKPISVYPIAEQKEKILIPYGCAKLRMTEMPIKREKNKKIYTKTE